MYYYGRDKRRRLRKRIRLVLSALAGLGVLAAFYFLIFSEKHSILAEPVDNTVSEYAGASETIKTPGKKVMIPPTKVSEYYGDNRQTKLVRANRSNDNLSRPYSSGKERNLSASISDTKKPTGPVYEVVSVAHFYDKPDIRARRNDSINYWNESYASIKPAAHKNGFLYVVFKYPTGETAKGWLREKDLKKVNTAYGDNKD